MKAYLLIFALAILTSLTSCDKDSIKLKDISGLYVGFYNIEAGAEAADSLYYSFFLRRDSVIQFQSSGADGNTYYGTGRWSVRGAEFSARIKTTNLGQQGVEQNVTGTFNRDVLSGFVENVDFPFRARFELHKVD